MSSADLQEVVRAMPFAGTLGLLLTGVGTEEVTGTIEWTPERCTAGGIMHGGVIMAFADTLGACCASLHLPDGAGTTTIESKTNFFRAVRGGSVLATSRPLHVGRTTIVVQTDLRDDDGRLVAQVTQTQAVLPARG